MLTDNESDNVRSAIISLLELSNNGTAFKPQTNSNDGIKKELFGEEDLKIHMLVVFKKVPTSAKPIGVLSCSLPYPIFNIQTTSICLFVKDLDEDKWNPEIDKDAKLVKTSLVHEKGIKEIDTVISLRQLKREFKTYEAKRKLSTAYDMFLCDKRVLPLVSRNLGKAFHKHKTVPIPFSITSSNLKAEIQKCLCLTRCILKNTGTRCSIVVGRVGQTGEELYENFSTIFKRLITKMPGGLANVRSIHLSTNKSPQLPVYVSFDSANMVRLSRPLRKHKSPVIGQLSTLDGEYGDKIKVHADGKIDVLSKSGAIIPSRIQNRNKKNTKGLRKRTKSADKRNVKTKKAKKLND